jgi:Family of unknown function (DUF6804)
MKRIWVPQVIASLMLLWALNPDNPYGYYVLLRWVCCAIFIFLTYQAYMQNKQTWIWVFGVTALIYNPVLRVHLGREIWSIVNILTIGIVLASILIQKNISVKENNS